MNTLDINEDWTVPVIDNANLFECAKRLIDEIITPYLIQFNNVSELSFYEDVENRCAKYLYDVGYNNLAVGFVVRNGNIETGVCKKDDTESVSSLVTNTNGILALTSRSETYMDENNQQVTIYHIMASGYLRTISHKNELKVLFSLVRKEEMSYIYSIVMDVDNYGDKFIRAISYNRVYYDDDAAGVYVMNICNNLPLCNKDGIAYVIKPTITLSNNIRGIPPNIIGVSNIAISGQGAFQAIDIEGVQYRRLEASNYNHWYRESEV